MLAGKELVPEIRIVRVMDCLADPAKIRVIAEFSDDVQEALPYLAALLPQAGYNHAASILSLIHEGRLISLYPRVATVAKAADERDAATTLEWLRELINEAYARRHELRPCLQRRHAPILLDIYRLLPKTNCGLCGEATCMAMAGRFILGNARLSECSLLEAAEFGRNRRLLGEWLGIVD